MKHLSTAIAIMTGVAIDKVEGFLEDHQWNFAPIMYPPNNPNNIFVFGSNLGGYHGGGAAWYAKQYRDAEMGVGYGITGNNYAFPTKDADIETLPIETVAQYAELFLDYAKKHPQTTFHLTPVGCGLAGFTEKEIAPMFKDAPINVVLPGVFFETLLKLKLGTE